MEKKDKRHLTGRRERNSSMDSAGRSVSGKSAGTGGKRRGRRPKNTLGKILLAIQAVVSIAFFVVMVFLNMMPFRYLIIIAGALLLLWGIGDLTQAGRNPGKGGKIYIVCISLILALGTFYVGKVSGALGQIAGGNKKINTMVVAVLADDPAENIQDAGDYVFGVQYELYGNDVKETMKHIEEELGTEVKTKKYRSVNEQAKALHDGKVQAIVYNEGYKGILEEEFHGYSNKVKIIYTHNIETELKDLMLTDVKVKTEPFSVYLSGIDVYGEVSQNSRSDVNIIATVNPKTRQILLITTPRDYYVEIPGISKGKKDKLTHAGLYGVDASIKTLSELYEMEIPFFARINFTSLIEIVDQLGGVDVDSEYEFTTGNEAGMVVEVKKGINHFNGKEALAFARERKHLADGDNQRGKNQQAVITAMINKMISPSMLLKANRFIDSVSGNVETNMTEQQIQTLIKMQLKEGGSWNIVSVAAEGEGSKNVCYSSGSTKLYVTKPDYDTVEAIQKLINKVENGEILTESDRDLRSGSISENSDSAE